MRLLDLEPKWIHPNIFAFKCPHCREVTLTCKNVPMEFLKQWEVFDKEYGPGRWNTILVGTRDETAWSISGTDFSTMTVNPSLDASASGHWHGFIRNGEIA